jgi:hypothetical protein
VAVTFFLHQPFWYKHAAEDGMTTSSKMCNFPLQMFLFSGDGKSV